MKTVFKLTFCVVIFSFVHCKKETSSPKVTYEDTKRKEGIKPLLDSTSVKIADLPISMEGNSYLLHPVGDVRVYEDSKSIYGSSKTNQLSYAISNYNRFEITGFFDNVYFQHTDSTALKPLVNTKIQIQTVTFLDRIASKSKKQILVYTLVDGDTNKDGLVNQNDIKSLYLSFSNGKNFLKLSKNFQELIDWNVVETQNKLYFRCIQDINKNGAFDKNDKVHYHFVNLLDTDWVVEEYFPF